MTQYFKLEFYQWPRKNCKTKAGCQKQCFRLLLYPRQHYKDLGRPMHPAAPAEWNGALFYRDSVARTQRWLLLPQTMPSHYERHFIVCFPSQKAILDVHHGSSRLAHSLRGELLSKCNHQLLEDGRPPGSGLQASF